MKTVSMMFNKSMRNLRRDIGKIISDLPSMANEFISTTVKDTYGRDQQTYIITEKGFYMLTASFTGTKAREIQSNFYNKFKRLKEENTLLKSALCDMLEMCPTLSTSKIMLEFKRLKEENTRMTDELYIQNRTYCISDIAQEFKDLTPWQAQHELYMADWLEYRQNGLFPTEWYGTNNTIVSTLDTKRGRYYPRYTVKGVKLVREFLIDKGYKLK